MVLLQRKPDLYQILVEKRDLDNSEFRHLSPSMLGSLVNVRVKGVQKVEWNSGLMIVSIKPKVRRGKKTVHRGPLACENRIRAALRC